MGLDETKANKEDPNVASVPRPFRPSASGRNKFQPTKLVHQRREHANDFDFGSRRTISGVGDQ